MTSECGRVALHIFSERNPDKPHIKVLNEKTIARIESDFQPYFARYGRQELLVIPSSADTTESRKEKKKKERPWYEMSKP